MISASCSPSSPSSGRWRSVSAAQPQAEHAPPAAAAGQTGKEAAAEPAAEGEGGHESPWALPARIFNFALLAGGLFYLLRSPLMGYLSSGASRCGAS